MSMHVFVEIYEGKLWYIGTIRFFKYTEEGRRKGRAIESILKQHSTVHIVSVTLRVNQKAIFA